MAAIDLKALVGKLDTTCRRALEGAAGLCLSRSNYNVEIEHWLVKLLEPSDTDLVRILKHYDVDASRVNRELTRALDQLRTGNARSPELSLEISDLMREAWVLASIKFNSSQVRSGTLLAALRTDRLLSSRLAGSSPELAKIPGEQLAKDLPTLVAGSAEDAQSPASVPSAGGQGVALNSKTPALDQYTQNLTEAARSGKIDPVLGRDPEIRQIIDILMRRRQNNPILTGEAGVGKTAVVEGFALRIAAGDVPPPLKNVTLRTLDLGLLQAGAGVKGEFENRLKSVIEEVKASPTPIILFIDEAHTLIGAGGQAGQGDAANLLKPALARGELRTVAATTWAEYKKYFEKDAAMARRFQVVKVEEPGETAAIAMMRGLAKTLEKHHRVSVLDEAIVDAVRLSHRYISGRQLPDKSVSLLDTACARVAIGSGATPAPVEDLRRRIQQLGVAAEILQREAAAGAEHAVKIEELIEEKAKGEVELKELETRWQQELALVTEIRELRGKLAEAAKSQSGLEARSARVSDPAAVPTEGLPPRQERGVETSAAGPGDLRSTVSAGSETRAEREGSETRAERGLDTDDGRKDLMAKLHEKEAALRDVQGETPLVQVCVDGQAIAEVVSAWTGIPVGRMVSDQIQTVLHLKQNLEQRIVGQSHALEAIAQSIRTSRAKLADPRRPIGVFMLVGPSGVGKTETAIALADLLYGGEQNMTVLNMSEFKEEHKVSLLMGSPPGYVGYGEGGILTEAVRRRPYSVVLLDELEKSHPGVQEIFYQVFDKGTLRDGEGRDIDFKNTVILMTSNAASDKLMRLCADLNHLPDAATLTEALYPELLKIFKPAFLGRVTLVPYFPLGDEVLRGIAELKLGKVRERIAENYDAKFECSEELLDEIVARCNEVESGARNIDHIITRTLLPELSAEFLARLAEGRAIREVFVDLTDDGRFSYRITDASGAVTTSESSVAGVTQAVSEPAKAAAAFEPATPAAPQSA